MRRAYAASLELIAELDARHVAAEVGYSGLALLLRDVVRISSSEARRRIGHAEAVSEVPLVSGGVAPAPLPVAAAALSEGALGADHLDVIAKAVFDLPPHVPDADREVVERTLVEAAHSTDPRTLARLGHDLRAALDQDGSPPDDREPAEPVNELHLLTKRNGRLVIRGEFDQEASALITTAISPLARPRPAADAGPDPRSAAERQGDALVELVRLVTDAGALPSEGGEKPHVLVTVPLDTLRAGIAHRWTDAAGRASVRAAFASTDPASAQHANGALDGPGPAGAILDGVGALDAGSARRIACDARIIPIVLGSRSEPLELGRASYTVPTALRRALILRDGGCAFPGCDRSHRWCHSHHVRHWADDGPTELANLVLLCGRHHRLIHHSQWECAITDGRAEFRPPRFVDPARTPRRNLLRAVARF